MTGPSTSSACSPRQQQPLVAEPLTVTALSGLNVLRHCRCTRHDFPTPVSPSSTSLQRGGPAARPAAPGSGAAAECRSARRAPAGGRRPQWRSRTRAASEQRSELPRLKHRGNARHSSASDKAAEGEPSPVDALQPMPAKSTRDVLEEVIHTSRHRSERPGQLTKRRPTSLNQGIVPNQSIMQSLDRGNVQWVRVWGPCGTSCERRPPARRARDTCVTPAFRLAGGGWVLVQSPWLAGGLLQPLAAGASG